MTSIVLNNWAQNGCGLTLNVNHNCSRPHFEILFYLFFKEKSLDIFMTLLFSWNSLKNKEKLELSAASFACSLRANILLFFFSDSLDTNISSNTGMSMGMSGITAGMNMSMNSPISSVGSLSPMASPDIKPDISALSVNSPPPGSYFNYGMHPGMPSSTQSVSMHSPTLHSPTSSVTSPSMMSIGSPGSTGSPQNPHMPHTTLSTKHLCAICGDRASGKHYGVYRWAHDIIIPFCLFYRCPKISNTLFHTFLACILFFMQLCLKLLSRMANSVDPDLTAFQEQSDLGLHCLPMSFCQKFWWTNV